MDGALQAVRFAREMGFPFIGTWGGFQHALLEYARNVLNIQDAEHEETAANAPTLLISKLACSLVGKTQTIKIVPGSLVHRAYGREEVTEQFACSYGLNPQFRDKVQKGQLKITGVDLDGEVRIVELSDHRFYVATLFLPQISSEPESPHPLIVAYLRAALAFQTFRRNSGIKMWYPT
jgi:CTP synthase (UTP-ammonia lyase)